MSKLIAGRYLVDNDQELLAVDTKSPTQDVVQIQRWKSKRLDYLVRNAFLRRAKEMMSLNHHAIIPLIDFGYDASQNYYYLIYEMPQGAKQLSSFLKHGAGTINHTISILMGLVDVLIYLHLNNFFAGYIEPSDILIAGSLDEPLVIFNKAGLESFEILLGIHDDGDPQERNYVGDDIDQLAFVAGSMLTGKKNPTTKEIQELTVNPSYPESFRDFLARSLFNKNKPYSSVSEVKRDLLKALADLQLNTTYFLAPTKTVAQKLTDLGFINKAETYIAVDFLEQEFKGEKFARANDISRNGWNTQGETYNFFTRRFRLLCAPAQNTPSQYMVIIGVDCPPPTIMVADREQSLLITSSIKILLHSKIPRTADIKPLLVQLEKHRLESQTTKRRDLEEKSNLETWRKVLNLQKRLLDQFQVVYLDYHVIDDGNTLLVNLKEEYDSLDVSEDEQLMMSSIKGQKAIPVGYFRELDGNQLKIDLMGGVSADSIAKQGVIKRDNIQVRSILNRQDNGLRRLRFRESVNPDLLDLLTDPSSLIFDKIVQPNYWDNELDGIQKQAVKKALEAKDVFLVHGPPGTGKTRTIVELVRQILNSDNDRDSKILITSQSNVAVNHAISSLLNLQPGLRDSVVRVGREEKAGETSRLLLDQQLLRWSEQVKEKSSAFIEKKRKEFDVKPQLAECFSMIDECEGIKQNLIVSRQEIEKKQLDFQEISKGFDESNALMIKIENLRTDTSALLEKISDRDLQFRNVLEIFDKNYLGWATEFLVHANELAKISARRMELKHQIDQLNIEVTKLEGDLKAGTNLIRESLTEMFQTDLPDLESQRIFVQNKLSAQQDSALKLGRIQKISQEWGSRMSRGVSEFEGAYLSRCKVVGATCIGVAAKGDVSDMEFDWVIVDEAGRSTHPELLVPLVRGRKIVLLGDHRQLPPIIDKDLNRDLLEEIEVNRNDLETSLFKELIEPENNEPAKTQIRLEVQYRMNPAIGNLISYCFYPDRLLKHAPNTNQINHKQFWTQKPVVWLSTSKLRNRDEQKVGYSYQNLAEADQIKNVLDQMEDDLNSQNEKRSVGIIAGYMGQKRLLRQQIGRDTSRWPHLEIEINTVDAYQGQERDFIIYSVVRSNPKGRIGFLQDERRLNVALSRARELLVIVGNTETAEFANTAGKDNPFFRVIKYVRENPSECVLKEIA